MPSLLPDTLGCLTPPPAQARPLEDGLAEAIDEGKVGPRDDPKVRSKILSEEFGWDKEVAKKIWCFGPDTTGERLAWPASSSGPPGCLFAQPPLPAAQARCPAASPSPSASSHALSAVVPPCPRGDNRSPSIRTFPAPACVSALPLFLPFQAPT